MIRWLRRAVYRVVTRVRPGYTDDSLQVEIAEHLALLTNQALARGLSPEAARLEAQRQFGSVALTTDSYRETRRFAVLAGMGNDFRFALRALRRNPGYSFTIVLALALGIGATTAIFAVV